MNTEDKKLIKIKIEQLIDLSEAIGILKNKYGMTNLEDLRDELKDEIFDLIGES